MQPQTILDDPFFEEIGFPALVDTAERTTSFLRSSLQRFSPSERLGPTGEAGTLGRVREAAARVTSWNEESQTTFAHLPPNMLKQFDGTESLLSGSADTDFTDSTLSLRGAFTLGYVPGNDLHGRTVFKGQRSGGHFHVHHPAIQTYKFFLVERHDGLFSFQSLHAALRGLPEQGGAVLPQLVQALLQRLPTVRVDEFLHRLADELFDTGRAQQPGGGRIGEHDAIVALDKKRVGTELDELLEAFLALLQRTLRLAA